VRPSAPPPRHTRNLSVEDYKKKASAWSQKSASTSSAVKAGTASSKGPTPSPVVVVAPVVAGSSNPRQSMAMSDRDKWRQSKRMMRQSRMMANNQLSSILDKVSTLERSIVAVEAARQLAEQNVIDIATAKMEEDERVIALAEKLTGVLAYLDMLPKDELRKRLTLILMDFLVIPLQSMMLHSRLYPLLLLLPMLLLHLQLLLLLLLPRHQLLLHLQLLQLWHRLVIRCHLWIRSRTERS